VKTSEKQGSNPSQISYKQALNLPIALLRC